MQRENTDFAFSDLTISQFAGQAIAGQDLSNAELAAALRQKAEQGRLPARSTLRLVAERIEEAELATLMAKQRV
jgi:hypothetical protein